MIPSDNPHQQRRETLLTVILSGLAAGFFLFFLILVSDGLILYMVLAVAAVVALGFFHYVVWGYAMTQEVADEQARDAANRQETGDGEMLSDKIQHKRF
jgi:polyferredoxin